jgi:hypothetical protein
VRITFLTILGVILIGAGAVALSYKGIPYTSRDVVIDAGPLTATAESRKVWSIPPIVSGLVVAGGVLLLVVGSRKPR